MLMVTVVVGVVACGDDSGDDNLRRRMLTGMAGMLAV